MEINISKVFERDIDLFVIDEFISNKKFANLFLAQIGLNSFNIVKIFHSLTDPKFGESDITIIIEDLNKTRYGILIEDKIDAIAMSNQSGRYFERGNKGIENGEYEKYYVFIIAPESYLNNNVEAKKYPNKLSYEKILEFFKEEYDERLSLKIILLEEALNKKKIGYQVIEEPNVTKFWSKYYSFQEGNYLKLQLPKQDGPRGSAASWPTFNTFLKTVKIIHKSEKGFVDLTFNGYGEKINILNEAIGDLLDDDMCIVRTNKSAAVRIVVPKIDFNNEFEIYENEITEIMKAIERLNNLVYKIKNIDMFLN